MTRWDWSWEEPSSGRRPAEDPSTGGHTAEQRDNDSEHPAASTAPPIDEPSARERRFRRRRAAAGLTLVVLLVLIFTLLHSHGSSPHIATAPKQPAVRRLTAAESHALTKRAEDKAVAAVLAYTPFITQGGTKGNEVALTFDDGPGPYTVKLVETLNKLRVHATFFAIGEEERYFSAGTLAELRSGDVIGDHTETHPMMAHLSKHDQHNELLEQTYRIQLLGGPTPRLFRPPYGSFNDTTFRELRALHQLMVLWSTDTDDFRRPGVTAIVESALGGAHPGAIILMHDAGGDRSETIAALPAIVRGLRKRGLRPVTIPRLLLDDPPPRGQPIPGSLTGD